LTPEGRERPLYSILSSSESLFGLCAALSAIEQEWSSFAGDALARRSRPRSFADGILIVAVENGSAQKDIYFRKEAIKKVIYAKVSLRLKDIKAEIGRVAKERLIPSGSGLRRRAPRNRKIVEGPALEALISEIMECHPGMNPELAGTIARCRIMLTIAAEKI
jgi:hypothetical protein